MWFHRIQNRLILLFVVLTVLILLASGGTLHWMIRQNLEKELGNKLIAVARTVSVVYDDEEVLYLFQDPGPRLQQRMKNRLEELKLKTQVKRIYLFNFEHRSLLDTDTTIQQGQTYFSLQFYSTEINHLRQDSTAQSILFSGIDNKLMKTGFAPLRIGEEIVGGVAVEGQARFLAGVDQVRNRLYLIGIFSSLGAVLLGMILARSITRPMAKLIEASRQIGQGNHNNPIEIHTKDETQLLAETMEDMRQRIIQREKELKAMVAGVAHEIRNPLGGIELFTGILSDEVAKNEKAKSQLERIDAEVNHLKTIVERFLTFARPTEPKQERCDLKSILNEVIDLNQNEIAEKHLQFKFSGSFKNQNIIFDPMHLKQILLNLIQNAIQAEKNSGNITIHIGQSKEHLNLKIHNKGESISWEIQKNIFTPFFTTKEKGTGLGLSIARQLVEANGGKILFNGSDESGTEFEVRFKSENP